MQLAIDGVIIAIRPLTDVDAERFKTLTINASNARRSRNVTDSPQATTMRALVDFLIERAPEYGLPTTGGKYTVNNESDGFYLVWWSHAALEALNN